MPLISALSPEISRKWEQSFGTLMIIGSLYPVNQRLRRRNVAIVYEVTVDLPRNFWTETVGGSTPLPCSVKPMILEFGPFTVDPLRRQAFYSTYPVSLTPKAFEILLYLVENPGRIVSKNELRDAIWRGISVTEANLTQTIFLLRRAMSAFDQRSYIVTVPGRGYPFATEVKNRPAQRRRVS